MKDQESARSLRVTVKKKMKKKKTKKMKKMKMMIK